MSRSRRHKANYKPFIALCVAAAVVIIGIIAAAVALTRPRGETRATAQPTAESTVGDTISPPTATNAPTTAAPTRRTEADSTAKPTQKPTRSSDSSDSSGSTGSSLEKVRKNYDSLFTAVSGSVTKTSGDVARGMLILVNNDHKFVLGEPEDVMLMTDLSNRNFYVAYDYLDADRFTLKQFNIMNGDFVKKYGYKLQVCSGYRTIATQKRNFENSVKRVGEAETLKWFTRPGYSEHHTGYAIDYNTDSFGDSAFTGKGDQAFVRANCEKYGFIHRFAAEKKKYTGVNFEAWHFRQVGQPHAEYIKSHDLCLEEYIENIKAYSYESPLKVSPKTGGTYYIWYVKQTGGSTKIQLDGYKKYLCSGNNADGFIITAVK